MGEPRANVSRVPDTRRGGRQWKVAEILAQDIASDIASRRVRPGDMLASEATMVEHYKVGRSSLREALRILEVQGILAVKPGPGGGPVVREPGSAAFARTVALHFQVRLVHYRELVEARLALEPTMARLAAERSSNDTAALLCEHLAQAAVIPQGDHSQVIDAWADFHFLVGGLSGNGVMDLLSRALGELYRERVVLREQAGGRVVDPRKRQHTEQTHADIAAAIIAGKATRAERLMREHMHELSADVTLRHPQLMDEVITWG